MQTDNPELALILLFIFISKIIIEMEEITDGKDG
jgi:hypothetical protein